MSSDNRYVLIIAGGAGTRLWPLSRASQPKQFQRLAGTETLLQHMAQLAGRIVHDDHIFIMTAEEFVPTIREQLSELPTENIITEPARRDTGPAITLAMLWMRQNHPNATVALLWSDHLIQDAAQFERTLDTAFTAAETYPTQMVTLGANPTTPETGFGYIEMGKEIAHYNDLPVFEVKRFIEKPDYATALRFTKSWEYLWNVGYEVMNVASFMEQLTELHPELKNTFEALAAALSDNNRDKLAEFYKELPKISIEFLFTQQLKNILVVPADMGWSDVGNWNILHEVLQENENTLVTQGPVSSVSSSNSLILAKDRLIAIVGVNDIVVVDSGDAILIMHKDAAQAMKTLHTQLAETNPELL